MVISAKLRWRCFSLNNAWTLPAPSPSLDEKRLAVSDAREPNYGLAGDGPSHPAKDIYLGITADY